MREEVQHEHYRLLIVEDEEAIRKRLKELYVRYFAEAGCSLEITETGNVYEARRLAKAAEGNPYDLVSLDVNLGDRFMTGIDLLDTFRRFESAWMVTMVTGIEEDPHLDDLVGNQKGEGIRKGLRAEIYKRFPAERLMVVEKPSVDILERDEERWKRLLAGRIAQIATLFRQINRLRYVFRPIEFKAYKRVPKELAHKHKGRFYPVPVRHWQIRFGCGELRTLPDMAGFATLHFLLENRYKDPITPEAALLVEPKNEKVVQIKDWEEADDPVSVWFKERGVDWNQVEEKQRNNLIQAALSVHFKRYVELREIEESGEYDELAPSEIEELEEIREDLGPLRKVAELAFIRLSGRSDEPEPANIEVYVFQEEGMSYLGGDYDKTGGRRGKDSPAAALFRARMKRVKDALRENGFVDFAEHLNDSVMSAHACWNYNASDTYRWTT